MKVSTILLVMFVYLPLAAIILNLGAIVAGHLVHALRRTTD